MFNNVPKYREFLIYKIYCIFFFRFNANRDLLKHKKKYIIFETSYYNIKHSEKCNLAKKLFECLHKILRAMLLAIKIKIFFKVKT